MHIAHIIKGYDSMSLLISLLLLFQVNVTPPAYQVCGLGSDYIAIIDDYIDIREYQLAQLFLNCLVGEDINDFEVHYRLTDLNIRLGEYDLAIDASENLLALELDDSQYLKSILQLATIYNLNNDFNTALSLVDELIATDTVNYDMPLLSQVYQLKAEILFHRQEYEQSFANFVIAVDKNPENVFAILWIHAIESVSDIDMQHEYQIETISDENIELWNNSLISSAYTSDDFGHPTLALVYLDIVMTEHPYNIESFHVLRSYINNELNNHQNAIDDWTILLEMFGEEMHPLRFFRGCAYVEVEMYQRAVDDLEAYLVEFGPFPDAYLCLANAWLGLGDNAEALDRYLFYEIFVGQENVPDNIREIIDELNNELYSDD